MDYCLDAGDSTASIFSGAPQVDIDGDGELDGLRLDIDGDGLVDDAVIDLDGDGLAEHAAVDIEPEGSPGALLTDDGSGTWTVGSQTPAGVRWFGLDGVQHSEGPADVDGDGAADRLVDVDRDGLADRAVSTPPAGAGPIGYVDTDGDGRWDLLLSDADGDGAADTAGDLRSRGPAAGPR